MAEERHELRRALALDAGGDGARGAASSSSRPMSGARQAGDAAWRGLPRGAADATHAATGSLFPFASIGPSLAYAIVRLVAACVRSPDEHLAGLRVLLQARGDVDGVAADHQLAAGGRFPARDDLAGVDADPEPDLGAVAARDAFGERAEAVLHGERSAHSALGVVLVRLRDAEDGEHRVADELLRRAPEALDLGVDQRRRARPEARARPRGRAARRAQSSPRGRRRGR